MTDDNSIFCQNDCCSSRQPVNAIGRDTSTCMPALLLSCVLSLPLSRVNHWRLIQDWCNTRIPCELL